VIENLHDAINPLKFNSAGNRVTLILPVIVLAASSCTPAGEQDSAAADPTPMAAETFTSVELNSEGRRAATARTAISTERSVSNSTMP
jgi:hypothetical protein